MRGVKVGYAHTVRRPFKEDDQERVEIDMMFALGVARAGEANDQQTRLLSIETPEGRLVRFRSVADVGSGPMVMIGQTKGTKLELAQKGAAVREVDWPADAVGFSGVEESLRRKPLTPGERREFTVLVPFLNQVARAELVAVDYEETALLTGTKRLLRVEVATRIAGTVVINETQWIDEQGETLKARVAAADQETYRVTREVALAAPAGGKLDLIRDLVVKLQVLPGQGRPPGPLDPLPQANYRVTLKEDDPAILFASGATQQAVSLAPHVANVTVWRAGPGTLPARADLVAEPAPGPEYLASSSLVQCDDAAVKELAANVTSGTPGSAERATALAAAVHGAIAKKNFTQALASAAEVARRREGDCTEHSVLLAAMARASGIPARVAVGLVYVNGLDGFGFHMWTEVYVDSHWLPLDATFGTMVGPGHLKLTDSPLAQGEEFAAFLTVARVVGQLEVAWEPATTE